MRLVLALALLATACGDDDSGGSRPLTVDDLPSAYRAAECTYLVACGHFPDRTTCLSANLPVGSNVPFDFEPNVLAAINAGRVQLDLARAEACIEALGARTCDITDRDGRTLRVCFHYLHGTRAGGEPCFINEECISQRCSGGSTIEVCAAGTCVGDTPPPSEPMPLGLPCTSDPGCVDGAFCDHDNTGRCVALHAAGESCINFFDCDYGLACVGDPGARICKSLPASGEPCPDHACRDDGTYCASSGACEPVGLQGAACTGAPLQCAMNFPCDLSTGTCTRGPGVGEPCATGTSVRCFDAGLVCDETAATCIVPRADGEPCTIDGVCNSEHCDFTTGACAPAVICF